MFKTSDSIIVNENYLFTYLSSVNIRGNNDSMNNLTEYPKDGDPNWVIYL